MPSFGSFIGGAGQGAALGSSFGLPGTIAGGAIGGIASLFSDSPEEQRRKRQEELKRQNEIYRQQALARAQLLKQGGIKDISGETATQLGRAQSDVSRRAASLGRTGDTESMLLPVTSNINEAGGKRLAGAIQAYDTGIANIGNQYDQQAMAIEGDYAARPIEPGIADELMSAGSSYVQGKNYNDYLEAMRNTQGNQGGGMAQGLPNWQSPEYPSYPSYKRPYNFNDTSTWFRR